MSVGIDLTSVEDVRDSIDAFGSRYLERVYTTEELRDCATDAGRLAARFSAKEAAIKALAADVPIPWRSIGVRAGSSGQPGLELTGAAAQLAHDRGVGQIAVSITHQRRLAAAVVMAEMG